MTSTDLYNHLSTILADKSSNFFSEEERWRALNQACIKINQETSFLRNVYHVDMTPEDDYILLPEDFSSFASGADWLTATSVTPLEYRPYRRMRGQTGGWESGVGTPATFTVDGSVIYLSPKQNAAGTFRLSYVPIPNELNEDNEPPFYGDPRFNGYQDLIVYTAAWDLLMKDRDFDMADRIQRKAKERMVDFQESLRKLPDRINTHWGVGDIYGL